jgi:hypothetical protein
MWENYHQHNTELDPFMLVNGYGYLYATKGTKTLVFPGTYNTGTEKVIENLPQGFNLVGNPFIVEAYANRSYYKMNAVGDDIEIVENYAENPIPACTGVVVKTETVGESVTFRTSAPNQQSSANNGSLQMTLVKGSLDTRDAKVHDKAIVSFNEGSNLEKFVFNYEHAKLYIPQNGQDYAIAHSDQQGEMPLNFKAATNGEYTIAVSHENVELGYLHLIDNLAGTDVDLLQTPSYTFTARNDDYESRFRLVFVANNADLGGEGNDDFAFISNGQIILTGVTGNSVLQVIDLTGRVLASYKGANRIGTSGLVAGVYVLRIINGDDVKTQKIVIK